MEVLEHTTATVPLLLCDTCGRASRTASFVSLFRCTQCTGKQMGWFEKGHFFYFGYGLDHFSILYRKMKRVVDRFLFVLLSFLGCGSVAVFVWHLLTSYKESSSLFSLQTFITPHDPFLFLWWFGIFVFLFLWYHRERSKQTFQTPAVFFQSVKNIQSETEEGIFEQPNWQRVRSLSKSKIHEVSHIYTSAGVGVLARSVDIARQVRSAEVQPAHVVVGLLMNPLVVNIVVRLGVEPHDIAKRLSALFGESAPSKQFPTVAEAVFQMIVNAYGIARERGSAVDLTELFLASLRVDERIREILYDMGIEESMLQNMASWMRTNTRLYEMAFSIRKAGRKRPKGSTNRAMTALATPFLDQYSEDITKAAAFGRLSLCIGREREIESIFRSIEGGRKGVILVGADGVGRSTIIAGIAQRMVEEQVPKELQDKRLVAINVSALLAGADASAAQERLLRIIHEIARSGNIILFIENIQSMMGITVGGEQSLDVSDVLATELGKGYFITLASTTLEDYSKYIAHASVGNQFTRVDISEVDHNTAIQILQAKVGGLEYKSGVYFSYAALKAAVDMSDRLMHELRLPEKAIILLQEAAIATKKQKGAKGMVGREEVAMIVAEKTGVPVTSISEEESAKLLRIEEEMHKRMVGQEEAVRLVAEALRRARAELRSKSRPIASFLFVGPTGVGKTELSKTVAEVYFGSEKNMIRIDMSEYQDTQSIYRLIGTPGQRGSGVLTEAVKENPFSLLLLDEMEKADSKVLNLFLQVMDDGRITDSMGEMIDCTNLIIIATSNAGTKYIQDELEVGKSLEDIRSALLHDKLQEYFRPEFINRFDSVILFKPLTKSEIEKIAGLMVGRIKKLMATERGVAVIFTEGAIAELADRGYDPEFGARPLRRVIQDKVETVLSDYILRSELKRGDTVIFDTGGQVTVQKKATQ